MFKIKRVLKNVLHKNMRYLFLSVIMSEIQQFIRVAMNLVQTKNIKLKNLIGKMYKKMVQVKYYTISLALGSFFD